ncbi:MAG: hypothetical protein FJ290_17865 [Planctomycetes bacterium]|nr:hypothetical protein [Planctomycetota bacterium]
MQIATSSSGNHDQELVVEKRRVAGELVCEIVLGNQAPTLLLGYGLCGLWPELARIKDPAEGAVGLFLGGKGQGRGGEDEG